MKQKDNSVLHFRNGLQITFTEFYDRYYGGLYNYVHKWNNTDADDLLQEIFIKFYRSGVEFDSESHAKNYIYTIAHDLSINHREAKKRRNNNNLEWFKSIFGRGDEHPNDLRLDVLHTGFDEGVVKKIDQLPKKYRDVILLSLQYGKDNGRIAAALSVDQGEVKHLKYQAMEILRESCEELKPVYYYLKNMVFIFLALFAPFGHYTLFDLIKKIIALFF